MPRTSLLQSRSLKDRLTKVPDWFRPSDHVEEALARENLRGMAKRMEIDRQRRAAATVAALPKAAEIIRRFDVRAKSFLGGKTFPWASDSWERIQISRYRKQHPVRYIVWRVTGLMAPTL